MPKLTDTQSILLSNAAQRAQHSLYPLPDTHANGGVRVTKAIDALIKAGFAEERETISAEATSRSDGDVRHGVFATPAGLSAIGVEPEQPSAPAPEPAPPAPPVRSTKAALVLDLLQRDGGATLPELIAATGWLPHKTRAALTGLRKKGHAIERTRRDDAPCYRIAGAAA